MDEFLRQINMNIFQFVMLLANTLVALGVIVVIVRGFHVHHHHHDKGVTSNEK